MIHLFKYHFIQRIRCRDSMFWAIDVSNCVRDTFLLSFWKK